ncbi:enoyl-CoA hydratase [Aestuariivirga sp.]|uniref:enoyl-CoA hydratase n=1 Tax=Aestuariivirga sp. TaxID=2650926 RepID=UPI0039E31514
MITLPSPTPNLQAFIDGSTGWLVLNRPERRNALNTAMWEGIPALIKSLDEHVDVKAIVVRGAGTEAFAAGADISEFDSSRKDAADAVTYAARNAEAYGALRQAQKPVIAMIQGHCIGGGLGLALACDLRVADMTASFAIPPARLGLAYPLDGLRDLVSAIGPAAAKDLIFTAHRLGAEEALRLRLIDRAVADAEAETRLISAAIAEGAPLTLRHAKRALDMIAARPGHVEADAVAALSAACFDSSDYAEGRAAFIAKRKPRFTGR